jgi:hypothetical protein
MSQLAKNTKSTKDTIYIDPEDEITAIIDKLEASNHKIIALVLPKRSTALQSTVNMRLLKRSADNAQKRLVLITADSGLLPLAGAIGLYTAKNLQSKPFIPPAPDTSSDISEVSADEVPAEAIVDIPIDETKSIGELSGEEPDAIELDNSDGAKEDTDKDRPKTKKDKRLKVPDFDRFRVLILAGVFGAILLVVLCLYVFVFAPKAKIVIKADSVPVSAKLSVATSNTIQAADIEKQLAPVELSELKQSASETVPATGQKDLGTRATGTMTISNCTDNSITISSGTGVSKNGKTYITQKVISLDAGDFTSGGICKSTGGHIDSVDVRAQSPGEQYNVAAADGYAVAGYGSSVSGDGSAMSGGTTKIAKVVSQADVDSATQKIGPKLQTEADKFQKDLEAQGYVILDETATTTDPKITANPAIDQEVTQTTVTQVQTFSVLVIKKTELEKLLAAELNKQIDTKTQKIDINNLLDGAIIRVSDKKSPTEMTISVEKTANATAIFDEQSIKEVFKGKKRGDIQDSLGKRPGVKDVTVTYSPFWVSTTPKATKKITIVIEPVNSNGTN